MAVIVAVEFSESYKSLKRLLEILIFFWAVNCIDSQDLRERLTILLIASATLSTFTGFYNSWENGITHIHRAEGTMSVYMTYAGLLMLALLVAAGKLPSDDLFPYVLAQIAGGLCALELYKRVKV